MNNETIPYFFHHIHHCKGEHHVHHCGGEHKSVDPKVDYEISHCSCGRHSINKVRAVGHVIGGDAEMNEVEFEFQEKCPGGGWHIESGEII